MGLFKEENKDCLHKKEITQPLKRNPPICAKNKTIKQLFYQSKKTSDIQTNKCTYAIRKLL